MARFLLVTALVTVLMLLAAGLANAAEPVPQPEPHCTDPRRMDAGKPAPCSGVVVSLETYADCLTCANAEANPCIAEKAERDAATVMLEDERAKHRATRSTLDACEAAVVPAPKPLPSPWYARPGFWTGLGVVAAAVGGAFATDEHPAWYILGGAGAGVAFVEAVR